MKWIAAGVLALLVACGPDCYLALVDGSDDNRDGLVHQSDQLRYQAHIQGEVIDCGGIWLVNGIEGGSAGFGWIDTCGRYTAPAVFPTGIVEISIEATFPGRDPYGLACEYAYATLHPLP